MRFNIDVFELFVILEDLFLSQTSLHEKSYLSMSLAACFSQEDQLRYLYDPMDVTLGKAYQFKVAPLAWNPCREYSLQLIIGKQSHNSE